MTLQTWTTYVLTSFVTRGTALELASWTPSFWSSCTAAQLALTVCWWNGPKPVTRTGRTELSSAAITALSLLFSVEPHLRAEMLLRGDLIFHEFIHKLTWPIMRQPHALRSLFITLHCVTLLRLNLVQSVYDAVSRIRAKHVSNRCSEFVLWKLVYREIFFDYQLESLEQIQIIR